MNEYNVKSREVREEVELVQSVIQLEGDYIYEIINYSFKYYRVTQEIIRKYYSDKEES